MADKKYVGEPFCADVEPGAGGNIRTEVSGWGYWNVWLGIESYVDGHDQTVLNPGDAVRVAWNLGRAAVVCQWKRIGENSLRRIATKRARANRG